MIVLEGSIDDRLHVLDALDALFGRKIWLFPFALILLLNLLPTALLFPLSL